MPGSRSRSGNLQRVFGYGQSPLLNHLARLSVLYEDFRVELSSLTFELDRFKAHPENRDGFAFVYFMRRSLATLVEFNSVLAQVVSSREYKDHMGSVGKLHLDHINEAVSYFQANFSRIKEFRNAVGGHVLHTAIEFATRSFPPDLAGTVRWVSPDSRDAGVLALELPYAHHIVAGAIASTLPQGGDVETEIAVAVRIIMESYPKIQGATYALVHEFLWPKFG
jgi:hypothetical protein